MTDAIRPLIAGNWKMNGLKSSMAEFEAMLAGAAPLAGKGRPSGLSAGDAGRGLRRQGARLARSRSAPRIAIRKPSGAHTGDLSAEMFKDLGATRHHRRPFRAARRPWRDRRPDPPKAEAAWRAGLIAIVCIGETREQRDAGKTLDVCGTQLKGSLPDGSTSARSGGGL